MDNQLSIERNIKYAKGKHPNCRNGFKKGQPLSLEMKEKLRKSHLGYKFSDEAKLKMRLAKLGKKRGFVIILSSEARKKISIANKGKVGYWTGKHRSLEVRKKLSEKLKGRPSSNKGRKVSLETRLKQRLARLGKYKGSDNPNWKGGITPINQAIRTSTKYAQWRKKVFERDNYTCVLGGLSHGRNLHADHIKPFALFPKLRFRISNGRTLCVDCHRQTDTWGFHKKNIGVYIN